MDSNTDKIAVIGIAGKFPGANNISELWDNLVAGKETITELTDDILSKFEVNYEELSKDTNYVKARGVLTDIDKFDAGFFGMTPKEAAYTDPQQRVWLETAWNAFENAGIDPLNYPGAIGVYAGSYMNTYLLNNILRDSVRLEKYIRLRSTETFQLVTGNETSYIPTKTAYKFNLKGPAVNVQTACSTSLVAIVHACQSLFNYESDVCIAGGVCILTPQETGYLYQEGAIPSPDGHCRPFDKNAQGTVFSNGIGIVVLKRLSDALKDKDRIYATVSGWALNNDGNKKVSYTAPSIDGQAEVIMMAHSFAGISPEEIAYVEAHGTATPLGDPIEIAALSKAFSKKTNKKQYCGIGSVKSNFGHTDAAAGVASFIKSCLSIYNRTIPPTINFTEPNPHIDFANTPFYVQSELKKWEKNEPLVIGVSSFGIGGTNAHVILEEPPQTSRKIPSESIWPSLLVISAKSEIALKRRKENLVQFLQSTRDNLSDIAFTLQFGKNPMPFRSFCESSKNLSDITSFVDGKIDESKKSIAFAFPGQGAQYINMGKELYEKIPSFKAILDDCFEIFKETTGKDFLPIIFNPGKDDSLINQTQHTQPALFIIEYSLSKLLISFGIIPDYLIGHSIGEYTAACISGVFDLKTALKIVIKRGELMQSMPSGKMLAVRSSANGLIKLNSSLFEIAAENTESACTISVKNENLDDVISLLTKADIEFIPLNTSHAFHSSAFDPILSEFERFVNQFEIQPPKIPFISCLTGDFIREEDDLSGSYWAKQLRNTVLFNKGVTTILNIGNPIFIEAGPNRHLSSLIRANKLLINKTSVIPMLPKSDDSGDKSRIISALGSLWNLGYPLDFEKIFPSENSSKVTVPDYPFERSRYWIDYFPTNYKENPKSSFTSDVLLERGEQFDDLPVSFEIKSILFELSGTPIDQLKSDINFHDFGFDSLFLAQFAKALEARFKLRIQFRQLAFEYDTIEKLSIYISESGQIKERAKKNVENLININYLSKTGKKTPLVLVHGGNSANFLPNYFKDTRPILNFSDLGSDGEKIKIKDIDTLSRFYIEQLKSTIPNGPYILCGFSFGGLVASKMAAIFQEEYGEHIPCLIFFDTKTPQAEIPKEPNKVYKLLYVVEENKLVFLFKAFLKRLRRIVYWIKKIKYYKIYHFINLPLPVKFRSKYIFSQYMKMAKNYVPSKIDTDLLIFKSNENPIEDQNLGWSELMNNVETINVEGDHLELMILEKNFKIIGEKMLSFIESKEDFK
jgi:acyl transferase domain-containing protein/thioesterase domain-containing protein/acyl carrier protein